LAEVAEAWEPDFDRKMLFFSYYPLLLVLLDRNTYKVNVMCLKT
jgi:hypothetical protein